MIFRFFFFLFFFLIVTFLAVLLTVYTFRNLLVFLDSVIILRILKRELNI